MGNKSLKCLGLTGILAGAVSLGGCASEHRMVREFSEIYPNTNVDDEIQSSLYRNKEGRIPRSTLNRASEFFSVPTDSQDLMGYLSSQQEVYRNISRLESIDSNWQEKFKETLSSEAGRMNNEMFGAYIVLGAMLGVNDDPLLVESLELSDNLCRLMEYHIQVDPERREELVDSYLKIVNEFAPDK